MRDVLTGSVRQGIPLAVALFVLGVVLSLNYKVELGQQSSLGYQRYQAAQELLAGAEAARNNLAATLTVLRRRLGRLPPVASEAPRTQAIRGRWPGVAMAADLTPLQGPGVEVTLQDSSATAPPGTPAALYLVHDVDVLQTVNQLLSGGAEAIAINGQRLTPLSQIRCSGPTITVNQVRTITPIHILAIGDPTKLTVAVEDPAGIYPLLTAYGIGFTVQAETLLTVPAYRGGYLFRYAQPLAGAAKIGGNGE